MVPTPIKPRLMRSFGPRFGSSARRTERRFGPGRVAAKVAVRNCRRVGMKRDIGWVPWSVWVIFGSADQDTRAGTMSPRGFSFPALNNGVDLADRLPQLAEG